ncbi:glycoside hydrolase family protein [Methylobacterium sp. WL6]|uniref:glycoside hydrolase family protein n=1 Tax=Methylobacterium sp. WL6 TaxID=2603901 RepID=UPI0016505919|nr:glycoside hydrolase family protein [Methylobacterium sp. WL6]
MARQTTERGKEFLSSFEGVVLKAYPDPGTGKAPWTIGVGHTAAAGAPVVVKGMVITHATAMDILSRDLVVFESWLNKLVKVEITQAQFDALASLIFNIGPGNFQKSSVLRLLNKGDKLGAAAAFASWNKAAGKVMSGLVRRRAAERTLFETGYYGSAIAANDDETVGVVMASGSPHPEGVRALQADLISLGLLPVGDDDGDFGRETEAAVRAFQLKHALTVDGRAGPATRSAMAAALKKAAKPIAVAMFPLRDQPLDLPAAA